MEKLVVSVHLPVYMQVRKRREGKNISTGPEMLTNVLEKSNSLFLRSLSCTFSREGLLTCIIDFKILRLGVQEKA